MRQLGIALTLALLASVMLPLHATAATGVTRTWSVGVEPFGVTVDPRDGKIYVAIGNHNNPGFPEPMYVIDPAGPPPNPAFPPPTIQLPAPQTMSVLDTGLGRLFVTLTNGTLAIVDIASQSMIGSVPNGGVLGVALDPATHRVFAATVNGLVSIDGATGTVLARRASPANFQWWAVAHDPARHRVYATNLDLRAPSVVVFDDGDLSIVGNVLLPATPRFALTVDSRRDRVYVGGYFGSVGTPGSLYAIDETSLQIVATLDLGHGVAAPFSTTLDEATHTLYASLLGSFNPSAIVSVDTATFAETGRIPLVGPVPFQPGQSAIHPDGHLYVSGVDARLLAQITVNHPPTVSVTLDESSPLTNDVVTATAAGSDPDRDPLSYTFTWSVNGAARRTTTTGATTDTFDLSVAGNGDKGDVITVRVVASDGSASSTPASASATIANSAPTVSVALSDQTPGKKDIVVATATASDPDGDALGYTFSWSINGAVLQTSTGSASTSSFDIFHREAEFGSVIRVDVVVSDGAAQTVASATATVSNRH